MFGPLSKGPPHAQRHRPHAVPRRRAAVRRPLARRSTTATAPASSASTASARRRCSDSWRAWSVPKAARSRWARRPRGRAAAGVARAGRDHRRPPQNGAGRGVGGDGRAGRARSRPDRPRRVRRARRSASRRSAAGRWRRGSTSALRRLGIDHLDRRTPLGALSGGEPARCDAAGVLLGRPTILLLDEPTNHLDLDGTRPGSKASWRRSPGTLLVVSHDRRFLDNTVTRIVELGTGDALEDVRGRLHRLPRGEGAPARAASSRCSRPRRSNAAGSRPTSRAPASRRAASETVRARRAWLRSDATVRQEGRASKALARERRLTREMGVGRLGSASPRTARRSRSSSGRRRSAGAASRPSAVSRSAARGAAASWTASTSTVHGRDRVAVLGPQRHRQEHAPAPCSTAASHPTRGHGGGSPRASGAPAADPRDHLPAAQPILPLVLARGS